MLIFVSLPKVQKEDQPLPRSAVRFAVTLSPDSGPMHGFAHLPDWWESGERKEGEDYLPKPRLQASEATSRPLTWFHFFRRWLLAISSPSLGWKRCLLWLPKPSPPISYKEWSEERLEDH